MVREGGAEPAGKWLGLAVFVLGIGLLVFVFVQGFDEFVRIDTLPRPGGTTNVFETTFLIALGKWLLLFLLAYVASAMAGRGIALYQAARILPAEEA
ncbi:MAG TPA: hypothetical protein VGR25_00685 [bacterium]|jgi:hypothetical protein|nr:hypothetical protein [bacterium]